MRAKKKKTFQPVMVTVEKPTREEFDRLTLFGNSSRKYIYGAAVLRGEDEESTKRERAKKR